MPKEFIASRLDVMAFAQEGARLSGTSSLGAHARLLAETGGRGADLPLEWSVRGESRQPRVGAPQAWLHLQVHATLPLACQRCLAPVDVPVSVDRHFRFVADEAAALAEDDASEEDLLVLSRSFDLLELVEDELLMEIPLVPSHDVCPQPVKFSVEDPGFEHESPQTNPFAVLGRLKPGKG